MAGYVFDEQTERVKSNHTVKVFGEYLLANTTITDNTGWYSIHIPEGKLTVTVLNMKSIEVYMTYINVSGHSSIRKDLIFDSGDILNSKISGKISSSNDDKAVDNALIKLIPKNTNGSKVMLNSNSRGNFYYLAQAGIYDVEFWYKDIHMKTEKIELHWSEELVLNTSLNIPDTSDEEKGKFWSNFLERVKEKWYYFLAMISILFLSFLIMVSISHLLKRSQLLHKSFLSNITIKMVIRMEKTLILFSMMLGELYLAGYFFRFIHNYIWEFISPYIYNFFFIIIVYYLIKIFRGTITDYVIFSRKREQMQGKAKRTTGRFSIKNFLKMPANQVEQVAPVLNYMILVIGILIITSTILISVGKQKSIFGSITGFFTGNSNYFYFIAITILVVWLVRRMVTIIFLNLSHKTKKVNPAVIRLAGKGINSFIIGFSIMIILVAILQMANLGEISSVILSIAIVSIGVASAIASTGGINNLITGMAVQAFRPIEIGDRIKFGDNLVGDVIEFSNVNVKIKNLEGEHVTIPHNQVLQHTMVNLSQSIPVAITIGATLGYDVPHEDVECLMLEAANKTNGVLFDPEPETVLVDMKDFYIAYELKAYVNDVTNLRDIKSELIRKCHTLFYENGVEILSPAYHVVRQEDAPKPDIMKGYVDSKLGNLVEVTKKDTSLMNKMIESKKSSRDKIKNIKKRKEKEKSHKKDKTPIKKDKKKKTQKDSKSGRKAKKNEKTE